MPKTKNNDNIDVEQQKQEPLLSTAPTVPTVPTAPTAAPIHQNIISNESNTVSDQIEQVIPYELYKGAKFVNREKERNYVNEYLDSNPSEILFLYGPKSSGKTTLINYILDHDFKGKQFIHNMINLRGILKANFSSFVDVFFRNTLDEDSETNLEESRKSTTTLKKRGLFSAYKAVLSKTQRALLK
jgi:hypothetical protein